MERLDAAIRAAEKARVESKELEERQGQVYHERLTEMNEKLEKLGELGDVSGKLDQLNKLDQLEEMHGKLGHLDKLSGIDEMHGKLDNLNHLDGLQDKLDQLAQMNGKLEHLGDMSAKLDNLKELESLGEVSSSLEKSFSDSNKQLEARLSIYHDGQINDLKQELAATRESQKELLDVVKSLKDIAAQRATQDAAQHEAVHAAAHAASHAAARTAPREPSREVSREATRTPRKTRTPTKRNTAAPSNSTPSSQAETFYCIVGEGQSEGEEQQILVMPNGVHIKSINTATKNTDVAWADIRKWRVDLKEEMEQGVGFEFETEQTKFPFRHPTTERAVAMLKMFQENCTMHLGCFQLIDEYEGDDDEESVLLLSKTGVAIQGQRQNIPWSAIAQWNLEPGELEEDGTCGMDLFEFWVLEGNDEETEYAFECDGIDAHYLKAGFELYMQDRGSDVKAASVQRQRVIV
jgi:hypothetical protein